MKKLVNISRILLAGLCLAAIDGFAQPESLRNTDIVFDQPQQRLGLSQRSVNCIIQGREGFLWIGTWSGLIKYDGYTTTIYQSVNDDDNRLKSNKITSLFEDKDGVIWVGTHMGGLFRHDKKAGTFRQFRHDANDPASISNSNVWSIVQDKDGMIWVGTENGLNKLDPSSYRFTRYMHDPNDEHSLSFPFVTFLHIDQKDRLWAGTEEGLNLVNTRGDRISVNRYTYEGGEPANWRLHNYVYSITSLEIGRETTLFWTTKKGLKKLSNHEVTNHVCEGRSSSFNLFRSMYLVDVQMPFLLLGSEMGLNVYDIARDEFIRFFGNFDRHVNLSHNTVQNIFIDRGGVLWVGTKKGLNKYDTYSKNFELYYTGSFDPTNSIITGITCGQKNDIWLSTIGGGLYRQDQSRTKRIRIATDSGNDFSNFIQVLYRDTRGKLWLGTAGDGIYSFNESDVDMVNGIVRRFEHYSLTNGNLSDDYIMSVTGSHDGSVWVGTWSKGLNRISPQGEVTRFEFPVFKQAPLVVMHEDAEGVLWIGTRGGGLIKARLLGGHLETKVYRHQEETNSLSNDFVNTLYEDSAGSFWVGTEEGLNLFRKETETFTQYPVNTGNTNNVVSSILEDHSGKLWLAGWSGITVLDPSDSIPELHHYDTRDGIQGGFYYNNVCYKTKDGLLYFGGSNGFNVIDPASVKQNPVRPRVAIRDFRIFNTPIEVDREFDGRVILTGRPSEMDEIRLKYYENSISFEFSALHYAAPEKNRYAYQLAGFDTEWRYTTADRRFANYTNLPAGRYVFKVKASNNDGVWSDEVTEVRITIGTPWWETPFALFAYAIVVLLLLYVFRNLIVMRTNFINNLKLERMERENIEKLNTAKLQFFTNISHEFKTPLTLIMGPVERIMASIFEKDRHYDELKLIYNNSRRLYRLIDQILDFRKIESGSGKLKISYHNISETIRDVVDNFTIEAAKKEIMLTYREDEPVSGWIDTDKVEKIFFNLVSNAVKFTQNRGTVEVCLGSFSKVVRQPTGKFYKVGSKRNEEPTRWLRVTVSDNGIGMNAEQLKHIFERFYRTETERLTQGSGIGLTFCRSLVEAHRGTIRVTSSEGEGSVFTIELPIDKRAYSGDEITTYKKQVSGVAADYLRLLEESKHHPSDMLQNEENDSYERESILIVEDDEEMRAYLKMIFRAYETYEAADGMEGLNKAKEYNPHLIICDLMMPRMNGYKFTERIKSNLETSHIPVIVLTARSMDQDRIRSYKSGADAYLYKPFNSGVLESRVASLLESRKKIRETFRRELILEPRVEKLTSVDEKFLSDITALVEENVDNTEFNVDQFVKEIGMSRPVLYRKIKALTGQSVVEFLRNYRIKKAARLLDQDKASISNIAYMVGFNNPKYFSKIFKDHYGVTPTEYLQNLRSKV